MTRTRLIASVVVLPLFTAAAPYAQAQPAKDVKVTVLSTMLVGNFA